MAETIGHASQPSTSAPGMRNSTGALVVLVLAFAPQLFELLWSCASLFLSGSFDSPVQVLSAQVMGLFAAPAGAVQYLRGGNPSSNTLLALIYSYPLLAAALFTLFARPRAPQDYFGGIALGAVALFALWASSDLQGMHGFSFGAGTAPRIFAGLLLGLGAAVMIMGLLTDGPHLSIYHWRGPLFVALAILTFAVSIRPLGLVVSGLASFLISALGTPETRWVEAIVVGVCLTIGCALLFPYVLGLPMPLFPRFLTQ